MGNCVGLWVTLLVGFKVRVNHDPFHYLWDYTWVCIVQMCNNDWPSGHKHKLETIFFLKIRFVTLFCLQTTCHDATF